MTNNNKNNEIIDFVFNFSFLRSLHITNKQNLTQKNKISIAQFL